MIMSFYFIKVITIIAFSNLIKSKYKKKNLNKKHFYLIKKNK